MTKETWVPRVVQFSYPKNTARHGFPPVSSVLEVRLPFWMIGIWDRNRTDLDFFFCLANGMSIPVYINIVYYNYITSSTAQGGGGSFKKRKTIGEIGCCESRMSKQKH